MSLSTIKSGLKQRFPGLVSAYSRLIWTFVIRPRWRRLGMDVFRRHYLENGWGSAESRSGDGSTLDATRVARRALLDIVAEHDVKVVLDVPCGDFNWMRHVDLPAEYIGADIVPELVAANQQEYGAHGRRFFVADLTKDALPPADLILCRDCLFHLSFADAARALDNIRRTDARFVLITTNAGHGPNKDIVTGEWRPLNLQAAPFNLPEPLALLNEADPGRPDKSLALWRLSDL